MTAAQDPHRTLGFVTEGIEEYFSRRNGRLLFEDRNFDRKSLTISILT